MPQYLFGAFQVIVSHDRLISNLKSSSHAVLKRPLEYHDTMTMKSRQKLFSILSFETLGRKQKAIHHLYFSYLLATANISHMNLKNKARYGWNYKLLY